MTPAAIGTALAAHFAAAIGEQLDKNKPEPEVLKPGERFLTLMVTGEEPPTLNLVEDVLVRRRTYTVTRMQGLGSRDDAEAVGDALLGPLRAAGQLQRDSPLIALLFGFFDVRGFFDGLVEGECRIDPAAKRGENRRVIVEQDFIATYATEPASPQALFPNEEAVA